ncbi:YbaB/EbfC family nucleoid-associated protein [Reichenbachiella sp. MALMAid0571]|uniref:YbaB/EbfC family nucleoid-associated protein n=1 Tax=Reichenbachiella sp. MALMAid0571 TaxID=3143939 RepID=UPI0032DFF0B8
MFDMMKMMGKVKEMQEKMKIAQESLAEIVVEAESGAGMVKATVNGKKELVSVNIDSALLNLEDKEMVQDLVVAATNKALAEADIKAKEKLKESTEGMMPNIPGFDLGNMFNG